MFRFWNFSKSFVFGKNKFVYVKPLSYFCTILKKITGLKNSLKNLAKRFGDYKNATYLCKVKKIKGLFETQKNFFEKTQKKFGSLKKGSYLCYIKKIKGLKTPKK